MPYLTGPNSAPIRPNKNKARNSNGSDANWKPHTAIAAAPISMSFKTRATSALSRRSASSPPSADNRKKGAMKTPPASVTSASPVWSPILKRMSRASAFFRKLSLNRKRTDTRTTARNGGMREATATSVSPGFSVPGHPDRDNQSPLALGDIHQQAFSFGVLYPANQLAGFVIIADRLGEGNARLDQHEGAHREIALHREVDRRQHDADDDHREGGDKRNIGKGDP